MVKVKIKILTAGSLNKSTQISGFTLIELIVVITIISVILAVSFPRIIKSSLFSNAGSQADNIAFLADDLKSRAIRNNTDFLLHIDTTAGKIWVTHAIMDDDQKEQAKQAEASLAEGTQISQVLFADNKKPALPEYQIYFRKQGYSDFVLIHLIENQNNRTLKIEPFLPQTHILDGHIDFEACN